MKTEKITFRLDPKGTQTAFLTLSTGGKPFKVSVNVHFVEGFKRFTCFLCRTPSRQAADVSSGSSPIDFTFEDNKKTNKIYVFVDFLKDCVVNLTVRSTELQNKVKIKKTDNMTVRKEKEDSIYRSKVDAVVSNLEKTSQFIQDKSFIFEVTFIYLENPNLKEKILTNIRAVSAYRITRDQRLQGLINSTLERVESAKLIKAHHLAVRKAKTESLILKRDMRETNIKLRAAMAKRHFQQTHWLLFLVASASSDILLSFRQDERQLRQESRPNRLPRQLREDR